MLCHRIDSKCDHTERPANLIIFHLFSMLMSSTLIFQTSTLAFPVDRGDITPEQYDLNGFVFLLWIFNRQIPSIYCINDKSSIESVSSFCKIAAKYILHIFTSMAYTLISRKDEYNNTVNSSISERLSMIPWTSRGTVVGFSRFETDISQSRYLT